MEKSQDFGEWNAFYSLWASALGWDQVHDVNTTLPGFIDAAFCGILIGAIVVMPWKNVSMKMECTMLGGGLRQDGATRKKRGVWALYTSPSPLEHHPMPLCLPYDIPLHISTPL